MEGDNLFKPLSKAEQRSRQEIQDFTLKQGLLTKLSDCDPHLKGHITLESTKKRVKQRQPQDVYNAHVKEEFN